MFNSDDFCAGYVHILENEFHLYGYSGNKQKFQWSYVAFPVSMAIILFFGN